MGAADLGVDRVHLRLAALIAPDERGTNHLIRAVEDYQAVHLAGKSDAAHIAAGDAALGEHAANGFHRGVPPVFGALFGPQRTLHADVFVRGSIAGADAAALIDQKRARTSGADIDAQPHRIVWWHNSVLRSILISCRRCCGTASTARRSRRAALALRWRSHSNEAMGRSRCAGPG